MMFGSAAIGFSGIAVTQFWWALFLLGVGWNFMFIGGTTLVVESYRPEERAKVQAFHDFTVFTFVAIAGFSSGSIQHVPGLGLDQHRDGDPNDRRPSRNWLRLYKRRAATAG